MKHTDLPIYHKGCDLVAIAYEVLRQMPRDFKRHLGADIVGHCTGMVDLMAMANAARGQQRVEFINSLLLRKHALMVLLRVSHDMKFTSHQLWSDAVEVLENIGRQGGGWLKTSNAMAPAA